MPRSAAFRLPIVRISSPAPTSSATDSAIWAARIARVPRIRTRSAVVLRAVALRTDPIGARRAVLSGASPKRIAESADRPSVKARTFASGASVTSSSDHAASARVAHNANSHASAAPAETSRALSLSNCRKSRPWLPPSAVRRLNSRCRAALRAASSIETLPQAMRRTTPTIAMRRVSG
jgi:hypothetical protein